ncbi:FdrA protein [Murinocardiopsis flavida]|uniref:FdrA protein n=1 Tax=Murinocardiopsis flavida TaxID=645275 RepID=A0A2P8CW17_9ACTN|nr:FdrA family protein [Murinocardiopsis flavida]PSK89146.1 FdrA protein [Murinocardiopsis flavida]
MTTHPDTAGPQDGPGDEAADGPGGARGVSGTAVRVEVRSGAYRDSVALMRISSAVSELDGVDTALVAMATELNLGLLTGMGAAAPSGTGPDDLLIAVRAADEEAADTAVRAADAALTASGAAAGGGAGGSAGGHPPPRTVRTAAARATADGTPATVALVSVPGRHAAAEAFDALDAGLDVMVFSDNVPVEHEVALKEAADRLGRLVMGPDCGTAAIGGAGLGFTNAVRPGPVGVVAASGTGAQQLMCLLDAAGVGISHCLGVGGRDLSARVGGRSTRTALRMLDADPATERIVLVSKPADPAVAASVRRDCAALATPVHTVLLGAEGTDLTSAAVELVEALGHPPPEWRRWAPATAPTRHTPGGAAASEATESGAATGTGALRGLFCGGTLADEAMAIAARRLGPIRSNIPLVPDDPAWVLPPGGRSTGHTVIDFGDDSYTAGRPHPMIDPTVRDAHLAEALADPGTGAVLLDIVLGHGAHPDPAAGVAAVLADARRAVPVVVTLCGTVADPQDIEAQAARLTAAGAEVHLSNATATRHALALLTPSSQEIST